MAGLSVLRRHWIDDAQFPTRVLFVAEGACIQDASPQRVDATIRHVSNGNGAGWHRKAGR